MKWKELEPTFPTLRHAGYIKCEHPRVLTEQCQDCGALLRNGIWVGGHLEFRRRPIRYESI